MDYGNGELIYGYEYYINKGLRYRNNQGSRRGVTVKNSINVDLEKNLTRFMLWIITILTTGLV